MGKGPNSCSCLVCCREWFEKHRSQHEEMKKTQNTENAQFWPALDLNNAHLLSRPQGYKAIPAQTPSCDSEDQIPLDDLEIPAYCPLQLDGRTACLPNCNSKAHHCELIARIPGAALGEASLDQRLTAASTNTKWLMGADSHSLEMAAVSLLAENAGQQNATQASLDGKNEGSGNQGEAADTQGEAIKDLSMIMANTERLLRSIKDDLGFPNIWGEVSVLRLTELNPITLGAWVILGRP